MKLSVSQQMSELLDYCHGLQEGAKAIVTYLFPQKKCTSTPERLVRELSWSPAYVKAWKQSSFRRAAIRVLALACSYYPMVVEPALLTLRKTKQPEDGSPYTKDEFDKLQVAVRPFACQIVHKMDLEIWTHHYDSDNKKIILATPPVVDFGRPSQSTAGASTSVGPVLSTPAAPTPARVSHRMAATPSNERKKLPLLSRIRQHLRVLPRELPPTLLLLMRLW